MITRVLHLTGSAESDFFAELSRTYARDCLAAVDDPVRWAHHVAHVTPDGCWRFPADLDRATLATTDPLTPGAAVHRLEALDVDVMVPQMFCLPGMTSYRGLFDVLRVPYVGNTATVMALGAHKDRARAAVAAAAGVDVPPGELLRPGDTPTLAPPVVVKPADSDNSLGVTRVTDVAEYPTALKEAFAHADEVLVERYVELGREVRCGVLEWDGALRALPLEEYAVGPDRPVRTYGDKLAAGADGDIELQAKSADAAWIVDPADPITAVVGEAARRCHVALGCRDYSLFDFRVDPQGRPWFLEAGLYCSFASTSVVATMAAADGIELVELFATMVERARER